MQAGLLVDNVEERVLRALVGEENGAEIELKALCDLVIELDGRAERVGGRPGLSEGEPVRLVRVLSLNVAVDSGSFGVTGAGDLEGDVGGRRSLDLERGAVEVVVLSEEVVGGLAEVLFDAKA